MTDPDERRGMHVPETTHTAHLPLVSVVIPVFNGARYLREAIESVREQTYPNTELIVVDDGSTDESRAVAGSFPGVQLIAQPNSGVAVARNRGCAAAAGELLGLLDQDDTWTPNKLSLQVDVMKTDPKVGYVTGRQVTYLQEGVEPPRWLRASFAGADASHPQPGTTLIRRSTFELVGPFDESYVVASDAEWFFRANDVGVKVRRLPTVVLRKRIHEENELSRVKQNQAELLRIARRSLARKRGRTTDAVREIGAGD